MAEINHNTLVQGWLRKARKQPDPQAWLEELNGKAVDALTGGDEFVITLSDEGASNTSERRFDAQQILQVTEGALQILEAETAAGGKDKVPSPFGVRYGDFSSLPTPLQ